MKLKEARQKAGMSMQALGDAVGVSPAAICRYEQGLRTPNVRIAKKIGEVLGIAWYELLDNKKAS